MICLYSAAEHSGWRLKADLHGKSLWMSVCNLARQNSFFSKSSLFCSQAWNRSRICWLSWNINSVLLMRSHKMAWREKKAMWIKIYLIFDYMWWQRILTGLLSEKWHAALWCRGDHMAHRRVNQRADLPHKPTGLPLLTPSHWAVSACFGRGAIRMGRTEALPLEVVLCVSITFPPKRIAF